ncbi:NfeD-like protein [Calothrix rhizosoleniae]|uniref:NfeD-like protein n=1 Tax=Calothrix rhizosoleniae TaxID=888997 RepID=UPI000B49D9B9|nr:NfeD-like protein [Calothrix rhizosoleniae]
MNAQIILLIFIAIVVGMLCGAAIVLLIVVKRRSQRVDSMISAHNAIGLFAMVEIPFDSTSKGKVRVKIQSSTVDFIAKTDNIQGFQAGERVFIVDARGNQVWVVSEHSLKKE